MRAGPWCWQEGAVQCPPSHCGRVQRAWRGCTALRAMPRSTSWCPGQIPSTGTSSLESQRRGGSPTSWTMRCGLVRGAEGTRGCTLRRRLSLLTEAWARRPSRPLRRTLPPPCTCPAPPTAPTSGSARRPRGAASIATHITTCCAYFAGASAWSSTALYIPPVYTPWRSMGSPPTTAPSASMHPTQPSIRGSWRRSGGAWWRSWEKGTRSSSPRAGTTRSHRESSQWQ
mmetsp:Transcript_30991/g.98947  ORF Transcript_30991/g.98947 Transcript_30991/m.98947 type:complete len:228 (-) Transcript_30991:443-1126(-)